MSSLPVRLAPVDALLTGLVDYAGLFPPAGLAMGPAVRGYAAYVSSDPDRRALGRFIVPAGRLEELSDEAAPLLGRGGTPAAWRVSALVGPDIDADMARIAEFNRRHRVGRGTGFATIDAIEGAHRQQSVERQIEILRLGNPARCVHSPQHRMKIRSEVERRTGRTPSDLNRHRSGSPTKAAHDARSA